MGLIKTCDIHKTMYHRECRECLHESAKEEKANKKDNAKRAKLLAQSKAKQAEPRKAPKKVSDKHRAELQAYNERVKVWKVGKMCVVFPNEIATTCHHARGRIGYADNWARDRGIKLLMDERYWIPASLEGHRWIEEHPQEAKDLGWSQSRLENLDIEEQTI